jgi:1-acyl-sn-glycerol-3-phosphate acyltransferase
MSDYKDLKHKHFFDGTAEAFMKDLLLRSDAGMQDGQYDMIGGDINATAKTMSFFLWFYKFYFRVEVHGVENIPQDGPGLIVSNHAPIFPFDATQIALACLLEPEKPRYVRTIVNRAIADIPFFSTLMSRTGQVIGCDDNVRRVFENQNLIVVFPTGAEGDMNTIFNKYQVHEFAVGFMEYALRFRTPVTPTCVTGSEEAALTLGKINTNLAGFKHIPITPIFPWLGPLGFIPFPSKFRIYFDPQIDYHTEHREERDNPEKVRELVEGLRQHIQHMLDSALGRK